MANISSKAAYEHPIFNAGDSQLISDLVALSKKSPKLVKSSTYPAPSEPNILINSWKMNEFKYYDIPSPFPTYARGLFTVKLPGEEVNGDAAASDDSKHESRYRIVLRGYDKFFNIGEVPWTEWSFIESNTRPPYILSLKSNGCIIFIGALTPSKLIVASKHAIGPMENQPKSHAQVGEKWLRKYIEQKGRTEADLAKQLWENNWTAVTELCDDSFEEHILPYPPDRTGLYLHGINTCTKAFCTLPPATVDAFADEWGFIKTRYLTFDTVSEVRSFTDEIRKTGTWDGEPIEGFVVRSHVTASPNSSSSKQGTMPYIPGSTFFFKIKFDEPYLLYRDWREVTKSLLSMQAKLGKMDPSSVPKSKMRREETKVYVQWAMKEIKQNPKAFAEYQNNKGIIKTREMFLAWLKENQGKKPANGVEEQPKETKTEFSKTIIVPVAIPGSGKTAVSVALAHIFGFAHTQSDDVRTGNRPGKVFVQNVMNLLKAHPVVIADKNNHLRQHRSALREESAELFKKSRKNNRKRDKKGKGADGQASTEDAGECNVRLLALYWDVSSQSQSTVFRACADRVRERGGNHQTLRADTKNSNGSELYEDVLWKFIRETEELSGSEVDGIVEMEFGEPLEDSIRRAVKGIVKELGLPMPDDGKVQEGIEKVKRYTVPDENKKAPEEKDKGKAKKTGKPPRYYGFEPILDLASVLDPIFESSSADPDAASFWNHLKKRKGYFATDPHITIVHKNELEKGDGAPELWERCANVFRDAGDNDIWFQLRLTHIVWDGRVMALVVDDLTPCASEEQNLALATKFVDSLTEPQRQRLHVTVGTRDQGCLPVEAMALVKGWRRGEDQKERKVMNLGENGLTAKAKISRLYG